MTWIMKLRIAAAAVIGVALVGIVCWPWQSPPDAFGSLVFKEIGTNGAVTLLVMAFLAGLISYFAAWPYGREIGILAVPFGLCLWAVKAGTTGGLIQLNPAFTQRSEILAAMRWEPLFWLLVIGCGFAGVISGQSIISRLRKKQNSEKPDLKPVNIVYVIISVLLSVVIVIFCLKIFAQDVGVQNNNLEKVSVQPALAQNIFAILLSFGIAAFAVKMFFNLSYVWPIVSCVLVTAYAVGNYMNGKVLETFANNFPAVFFPNAIVSILPVQMVTFGVIGSIAGYWMAIRYDYWRKHEL